MPPAILADVAYFIEGLEDSWNQAAFDYSSSSAKFTDASEAMTAVSVRRIKRPSEASKNPQL
jgi:hypothetical protein